MVRLHIRIHSPSPAQDAIHSNSKREKNRTEEIELERKFLLIGFNSIEFQERIRKQRMGAQHMKCHC